MLIDGLDFYTLLSKILGGGFDAGIMLDIAKDGDVHPERAKPVIAHFHKRAHFDDLIKSLIDDRTADYEKTYY